MTIDPADYVAIVDLASTYCDAVNRGAAAQIGQLFGEDGILTGVTQLAGQSERDLIGENEIQAFFQPMLDGVMIHQTPSVSNIRVDNSRAQSKTSVVEYVRMKGYPLMLYIGDYYDSLVRIPDGWRYARRRLEVRNIAALSEVASG